MQTSAVNADAGWAPKSTPPAATRQTAMTSCQNFVRHMPAFITRLLHLLSWFAPFATLGESVEHPRFGSRWNAEGPRGARGRDLSLRDHPAFRSGCDFFADRPSAIAARQAP